MEHLLTTCYVATRIWQWVAVWCNIPYIMAFSIRDLMEYHMYANLSKDKSKVVQAVILTACWVIWRARNDLVFSAKPLRVERLMEDIRSWSFLWVKNRSNLKELDWEKWCKQSFM
ncbi:hypothetical protein HanIR_Chr02g0061581 [Helianthus annuus]|nr:hypothetical protein HanIR_Chr02g0061581 [Helianthus annuus]